MCEFCHNSPCIQGCPNYEPEIIDMCTVCGEPIYEGDNYYNFCSKDASWVEFTVCEDCVIHGKYIAKGGEK